MLVNFKKYMHSLDQYCILSCLFALKVENCLLKTSVFNGCISMDVPQFVYWFNCSCSIHLSDFCFFFSLPYLFCTYIQRYLVLLFSIILPLTF